MDGLASEAVRQALLVPVALLWGSGCLWGIVRWLATRKYTKTTRLRKALMFVACRIVRGIELALGLVGHWE